MQRGDLVIFKTKIGPQMLVLGVLDDLVEVGWFTKNNEIIKAHFGKDLLKLENEKTRILPSQMIIGNKYRCVWAKFHPDYIGIEVIATGNGLDSKYADEINNTINRKNLCFNNNIFLFEEI